MALVETAGAANANTFATLAEFKIYRTNRLPAKAAVLAATDPQCEIALIVAARGLESDFDWTGAPVDGIQALTWPRSGMLTRNGYAIPTTGTTSITQPLKDAQCEWAYQVLAGIDLVSDDAAAAAGLSAAKAGSVAVTFQDFDSSSKEAVDMLIRRMSSDLNWLKAPGEVRRLLVPSWFSQPSIIRPVIFGAM